MSRSRAITGADTMLTLSSSGVSRPVSIAAVTGLVLIAAASPSKLISTVSIGSSVSCPAKLPSSSPSRM